MNEQEFRTLLVERKVPGDKIDPAVALAERFETFLTGKPANAETVWAFLKVLTREGGNTEENCLTLIRYCYFIKNREMYIALLELIDGNEVGKNLHRIIQETFSEQTCDVIFEGFEIPFIETPSSEKANFMHTVLARLESMGGSQATRKLLSNCLRDLPEAYYSSDREEYLRCENIDEYLEKRRQALLSHLESCKNDNWPYYTQEVTDEVIDFIRSIPEIRGVRQGNIIYEVKEPYQTKQYLAETDPVLKRYYYCHCPWTREAIKRGGVNLVPAFCNCSAGYHKRPWEAIFGQPLTAEVLESVVKGDDRCRFAIYLPEEFVPG
jgi:hypothetical protein